MSRLTKRNALLKRYREARANAAKVRRQDVSRPRVRAVHESKASAAPTVTTSATTFGVSAPAAAGDARPASVNTPYVAPLVFSAAAAAALSPVQTAAMSNGSNNTSSNLLLPAPIEPAAPAPPALVLNLAQAPSSEFGQASGLFNPMMADLSDMDEGDVSPGADPAALSMLTLSAFSLPQPSVSLLQNV